MESREESHFLIGFVFRRGVVSRGGRGRGYGMSRERQWAWWSVGCVQGVQVEASGSQGRAEDSAFSPRLH
ncbi:hypothetical protein E2C01_066392 [Portunus trituberculatus]|uniref:Uncharacterized protein n=1 Tax=Portunus trituberculatus TaxID=210409 RepID=A0A5B7HQT8_PORTR|nr:hypothetical protein [Portunus trituberculatus]